MRDLEIPAVGTPEPTVQETIALLSAEEAGHIYYEWSMLFSLLNLIEQIQTGRLVFVADEPDKVVVSNALLESMAIHLRTVCEWLGVRRDREGAKVQDHKASEALKIGLGFEPSAALKALLKQADKQVAHLSASRTHDVVQKGWDFEAIARELKPHWEKLDKPLREVRDQSDDTPPI